MRTPELHTTQKIETAKEVENLERTALRLARKIKALNPVSVITQLELSSPREGNFTEEEVESLHLLLGPLIVTALEETVESSTPAINYKESQIPRFLVDLLIEQYVFPRPASQRRDAEDTDEKLYPKLPQKFDVPRKKLLLSLLSNPETGPYVMERYGNLLLENAYRHPELDEILEKNPHLLGLIVSLYGVLLSNSARLIPRAFKKIMQTPELAEEITTHDGTTFLSHSSYYPQLAEETALSNPELQNWLKEKPELFLYAGNFIKSAQKALRDFLTDASYCGRLVDALREIHFSPLFQEATRKALDIPEFVNLFWEKRRTSFFDFLQKDERSRAQVFKNPEINTGLREKIKTAFDSYLKSQSLIPQTAYDLLRSGNSYQKYFTAPSDYEAFRKKIDELLGIQIHAEKSPSISFGFEIEPETGSGIAPEATHELRSFALCDPADSAPLLEQYVSLLQRKYTDLAQQKVYGGILGTLHFNIGATAEAHAALDGCRDKLERLAGFISLAVNTSVKTFRNINRGYLSPRAEMTIHPHFDVVAAEESGENPAIRFEIKGFGIPQDEKERNRFIEGLSWLAQAVKNPERLEKFSLNEKLEGLAQELVEAIYTADDAEQELLWLTPHNRSWSEYQKMAANTKMKLDVLTQGLSGEIQELSKDLLPRAGREKELGIELRDAKRTLLDKLSPELQATYQAGEDVSKIIRSLGFGKILDKIGGLGEEINSFREETKSLPTYERREELKELKKIVEKAAQRDKEALQKVKDLRNLIIRTRKKVSALQEVLFTSLIALPL